VERDAFVALRLDQDVTRSVAGPAPDRRIETVAGPTHLGYLGRGTTPLDLLQAGPAVVVDEQVVWAPALATESARVEPGGPALRPPVAARLSVHVYDVVDEAAWTVTDGAGREIGQDVGVTVALDPRAPAEDLDRAGRALREAADPMAVFGDNVALWRLGPAAGVTSAESPSGRLLATPAEITVTPPVARSTHPAGPMPIRVAWLARRAPGDDLSAFVHLVEDGGRLVDTFDAPPATHGHLPTSWWRDGEVVVADLAWDVPDDARPGARYDLLVGLYRSPRGARLAAVDAEGRRWPDDAVPLARVLVRPVAAP
jgi:hypothetical protein